MCSLPIYAVLTEHLALSVQVSIITSMFPVGKVGGGDAQWRARVTDAVDLDRGGDNQDDLVNRG